MNGSGRLNGHWGISHDDRRNTALSLITEKVPGESAALWCITLGKFLKNGNLLHKNTRLLALRATVQLERFQGKDLHGAFGAEHAARRVRREHGILNRVKALLCRMAIA